MQVHLRISGISAEARRGGGRRQGCSFMWESIGIRRVLFGGGGRRSVSVMYLFQRPVPSPASLTGISFQLGGNRYGWDLLRK